MKSSNSIFRSLMNRAIDGRQNEARLLEKKVNTSIQENVAMDKYSLKEMKTTSVFLEMRPENFSISDDRSKIVLHDLGPLALYDLSKQKKIWSITAEGSDKRYTRKILVSDSGVVVKVMEPVQRYIGLYDPQVLIYYQGIKIGSFEINDPNFSFESLKIIDDRIFGISYRQYSSQSNQTPKFYEWGKTGELIRTNLIPQMASSDDNLIDCHVLCNKNFYVVSTARKVNSNPIPIAIFDLNKNDFGICHLDDPEIKIGTISFVEENQLALGMHYRSEDGESILPNQKIGIFDLETKKIIKEHKCGIVDDGFIDKIVVNNDYIVFFCQTREALGGFSQGNLYSIDLHTNAVNKLKELFVCSYIYDLSISNNVATLIFHSGNYTAMPTRCVFDLRDNKEIQNVKYANCFKYTRIFSDNNSIKLFDVQKGKAIVEDFNNLDPQNNFGKESPFRLK